MRKRTRARQFALEVLYQVDLCGSEVLETSLAEMTARADDPDVSGFASALVKGTLEKHDELDRVIRDVAQNWDLSRMATIDRNILRLGTYELLHRDDIPPKVSINEAIELGKRYSTAESGTFVNGILDRIKDICTPGEGVSAEAVEEADGPEDAADTPDGGDAS
ncbi:MAG TPA: transcription antitermination factor NusB [Planctomycetota bacterium]|nr:transcription antitermination factor NusB [Planctomycetota bacterium]